jgi:hypothetical protein
MLLTHIIAINFQNKNNQIIYQYNDNWSPDDGSREKYRNIVYIRYTLGNGTCQTQYRYNEPTNMANL